MNLDLNRVNYCVVGTTLPGTLKLLPPIKHQQQVIVGDLNGVLQIIAVKNEETQIQFKTLPSDKIVTVCLGGIGPVTDKIFVATPNKVRAFNRKGKLFMSFDLSLTEPIKSIFVSGNALFVCGTHGFNHYRDGKHVGSYLCGDAILHGVALCPNNSNRIIAVLACSGRVLRFIENCRVRQTFELDAVPTVLFVPPQSRGDRLLCGYSNGKITEIGVDQIKMNVTQSTLIDSADNESAITALDMFDMSGEDKDALLVGRRDGTVQVFGVGDLLEGDSHVSKLYEQNFQESISSIQGGHVGHADYTEVVVGTYSGRVFGLTTKCIQTRLTNDSSSSASAATTADAPRMTTSQSFTAEMQHHIATINNEIQSLEAKVQDERKYYQQSTKTISDGISAIPMLPVNDTMTLQNQDGVYHLNIEIMTSIEFVLLQSDVPIRLLDVDKSTAVISYDPSSGGTTRENQLLATYRCQLDTSRVELLFRVAEGHRGQLCVYVTPAMPPKVSQMRQYRLRPLLLHTRVHSVPAAAASPLQRPYNTLTLRGSFSHAEMHSWLDECLPEMPQNVGNPNEYAQMADVNGGGAGAGFRRVQLDERALFDAEQSVYNFRNVLTGTILQCIYGKGLATFKTDNISTLSILKDFLTKNATRKRIELDIGTDIADTCLTYMCALFADELQAARERRAKQRIRIALLDLELRDEAELSDLGAKWRGILMDEDVDDHRSSGVQDARFDEILAILHDCFVDRHKLMGIDRSDEQLNAFMEQLTC